MLPLRKKYYDTIMAHNNDPKELRKEFMERCKLKNEYNKKGNYENWSLIKKKRNYRLSLLRKTKKAYFEKLNIKDIDYNKTFWKIIWPYFSDKDNNSSEITLAENNIVVANEKELQN